MHFGSVLIAFNGGPRCATLNTNEIRPCLACKRSEIAAIGLGIRGELVRAHVLLCLAPVCNRAARVEDDEH